MGRDPLLAELTSLERDLLLDALRITGHPRCTTDACMFDHQRRGEASTSFARRANAAINACRVCPALDRCDLKARLLSITGIVGGRYRPDPRTPRRAQPAHITVAEPNRRAQALLVERARTAAEVASRWRRATSAR